MDYLGQFAIVHLTYVVCSLLGFKFHKIRPIFKKGYPQVQVCMIFILFYWQSVTL